jgi:hypothetical protein
MDTPREPAGELEERDTTVGFRRVNVTPPPAAPPRTASATAPAMRAVPRALAATLLPSERITLGSSPHPVVLVRPFIALMAVFVAFGAAWNLTPPDYRPYLEALAAIAAAVSIVGLVRNLAYFAGMRAVATNRRIFIIRGIVWRRLTPLGNSELASSTLVQGIFGRMYGYGSIDVVHAGVRRALFRDMRDAGALYRECQAVANGVDGETWTPAVRQTIIP